MPERDKPARDPAPEQGEPAPGGAGGPPEGGREAPFVANIVNDPNNPPDALLLTGFVGRSSEDGYTRLYLNPELNDYVDIPNTAILYLQSLAEDESPLGASYVWIQRDAELLHGKAGTDRMKARFFEGRIARDFMGPGAGAAGGAGAAAGAAQQGVQGGIQPFPQTIFAQQCNFPTQTWWNCRVTVPFWRCYVITQPAHCRTLIDPDCLQVTPPWQLTINPNSMACGPQLTGNLGDLTGGFGAGGFGAGGFGGFAPQFNQMAAMGAGGAGAGGGGGAQAFIPRSDFAPCVTDWGPRCAPTTPFDGCPVPTTPDAGCPQPTLNQAGCPPPTSIQAGCPQPTTPNAGCPQPTTPNAGCPQPTTPNAGCPPPTLNFRCFTHFRPQCAPSDFGPCATDWGPRCQSQLLLQCPSQIVFQCTTNSGPFCFLGPDNFGQQGLGQQGLGQQDFGGMGGAQGGLQPQAPNINIQTISPQGCQIQITQPWIGCPIPSVQPWQCPSRFPPICPPSQLIAHCPPSNFPVFCPPSIPVLTCPTLSAWHCPTQPLLCGPRTLQPNCFTPVQTQVCQIESFACGPQIPGGQGGGGFGGGGLGGVGGGGQLVPQGPMGAMGAMGGAGGAIGGLAQPNLQGRWNQSVIICPSQFCHSQVGPCITAFNCPSIHRVCQSLICSQVCPSVGIACQSVLCTQVCPSAVDACPSSLGCTWTDPGTLGNPGWGQGGFGGLGGIGGIGGGFGG